MEMNSETFKFKNELQVAKESDNLALKNEKFLTQK